MMDAKEGVRLIEKDIDAAFFLFGLLNQRTPSYRTKHNFGTFLSKYGQECRYFSPKMLLQAGKLLEEAREECERFETLKELGDYHLNRKRYKKARFFYRRAMEWKMTYSLCYNLALCHCHLRDFPSMKEELTKATDSGLFEKEERSALLELLAFSCAWTGEKERAREYLHALEEDPTCEKSPDTLKLAYLCGDFPFILRHCKEIFSAWVYDSVSYRIVCQAYREEEPASLPTFVAWFRDEVNRFYTENPDIDQGERIILLREIDSEDVLPEIALNLAPAFDCDFYL